MNDLHRFAQQLVASLGAHAPAALGSPVALRDVIERVLPYRACRRQLGILSVEDYEMLLLRLVAGDGGLAEAVPSEAAARARAELDTGHPDPGRLRDLEDAALRLNLGAIAIGALVAEAEAPAPIRRSYELVEPEVAGDLPPVPPAPGVVPEAEPARPEVAALPDNLPAAEDTPAALAPAPEEPAGPETAVPLREGDAAAEAEEAGVSAAERPDEAEPEPEPAAVEAARMPADQNVPEPAPEPEAREAPPAAAPPPALHLEPPPRCPHCASRLPVGRPVRFCPHCGSNVVPLQCPRCSADLEPTWRHCVLCGAPVVHDSRFA